MRLATFNILHGRSLEDDRVDLDRLAAAVRDLDADILALQEVDREQARSGHADLTSLAAEALGATEHRFVAALTGTPGATWIAATGEEQPDAAAYGIALLSRYPVCGWEVVRLPVLAAPVPMWFRGSRKPVWVRDEPRVALAAVVDSPVGRFTVANTHLTYVTGWNRRQLRRLIHTMAQSTRPLVLMGDLNMGLTRAVSVTGMQPLAERPTFPADAPREQLDHVLLDGDLTVKGGHAVRLPLSDHRALVVDVEE